MLRRLADNVRTAADFGGELPTPEQGLPCFQDHRLRVYPYPARPPPLITAWLLRLPAQSVPPGFKPLPWSDILRRWARRMIVDQFNASMTCDAHCYRNGKAPEHLSRPPWRALGRGAAQQIPHTDGVGSWNALETIWERKPDGTYDALDFTAPTHTKWALEVIREYLGEVSDREMLLFIFEGVRWKAAADAPASPRRASVSHDLGEAGFALDAGSDSWDLVGMSCSVPNELWGVHIGGFTPCTVMGFLGFFKFADGSKKPAYVVCDDAAGFRYPVSAAYLAKTICDAATKKRVNKLQAPRAVARRV